MKRSPGFILTLGILFFLFIGSGFADSYEVYFDNHLVEADIVVKKGSFYFPAVALAKAMKLDFGTSKEMTWIGSIPDSEMKGRLILNGQPFSDVVVAKNGTVYANLKGFANTFGYKVLINETTQLIDLIPIDRPTNDKEFQEHLRRTLDELFPEPIMEDLKSRPELRDYLGSVKEWVLRSALEEDKAAIQLERAWGAAANVDKLQDMYDAIAYLNKGFQMEVTTKRELRKSFEQIVPPKEFEGSHAILKKMVERFSVYESLAEEGFIITKKMHPHTEIKGDMYETSVDEKLNQELVAVGKAFSAINKQQHQALENYLDALKKELDALVQSKVSG